jgi:CrcB protein
MTLFLVGLGSFFGAISRYIVVKWTKNNVDTVFPIGTLIVNLVGSFILGYLAGISINTYSYLMLGTGFLGAFTTFSTLKMEELLLLEKGEFAVLITYFLITYIGGISFAYLGYFLA